MSKSFYFSSFPKIYYNGEVARNIILKAQFFKDVLASYTTFYPYTVQNDERPDIVAFNYYGDYSYEWLVFFSNEIIDPYFQWPLTNSQFNAYIIKKYGSIESAQQNIEYYTYNRGVEAGDTAYDYLVNQQINPSTYAFLDNTNKGYWDPVRSWDREFQQNEDRRNIRLFDSDLVDRVEKELKSIFE